MKMIPYVSPLKETGVVQFEDTLSEENCSCFDLIYESLLLKWKAGNLIKLAVGMVLAGKPPAWLPVIHGRLKHQIVSSEASQEKKTEYDAQAQAKKLRAGKGKGKGKHSKGIRYAGVEKGKENKLSQMKVTTCKVTPPFTTFAQKDSQWIVSTAGILMIRITF